MHVPILCDTDLQEAPVTVAAVTVICPRFWHSEPQPHQQQQQQLLLQQQKQQQLEMQGDDLKQQQQQQQHQQLGMQDHYL